jgi:hypothetical protein
MNKLILLCFVIVTVRCTNNAVINDNRIMLLADSVNSVTLKDTMVIYESVCRGCAFEQSTKFSIEDTAGVVEIAHIETHDNSSPDEDGGSIGKTIVIVPKKSGHTIFKMYKFWDEPITAKDSSNFTLYNIEVKN